MSPPCMATLPLPRCSLHDFTQCSNSGDSQQAVRHPTDFLDLPFKVRHAIYELVLVVRHPIYLFEGYQGRVDHFAPDKPKWWLALLEVNRQIHTEAKTVLYAKNDFCLMDNPRQQDGILRSFINCVGPASATLVTKLCVSFPVVEKARDHSEGVKIRADSLLNFRLLGEKFRSLETLELRISSENSACLTPVDEDGLKLAQAALIQINAQLAAVASVKNIVVRVYTQSLTRLIVDQMQKLGWSVSSK